MMTPNGKIIVAEIAFNAWDVLAQLEKTPGVTILRAERMTVEAARAMSEKGLHDWNARNEIVRSGEAVTGDAASATPSFVPSGIEPAIAAAVWLGVETASAAPAPLDSVAALSEPASTAESVKAEDEPASASETVAAEDEPALASESVEVVSEPASAPEAVEPALAPEAVEVVSEPASAPEAVEPALASEAVEVVSEPVSASEAVEAEDGSALAPETVEAVSEPASAPETVEAEDGRASASETVEAASEPALASESEEAAAVSELSPTPESIESAVVKPAIGGVAASFRWW